MTSVHGMRYTVKHTVLFVFALKASHLHLALRTDNFLLKGAGTRSPCASERQAEKQFFLDPKPWTLCNVDCPVFLPRHHGADVHPLCLLGQGLKQASHETLPQTWYKIPRISMPLCCLPNHCLSFQSQKLLKPYKILKKQKIKPEAATPKSKRKSLTVSGTACTRYTKPPISSSQWTCSRPEKNGRIQEPLNPKP